jgi:hypothetical protein
MVAKIRRHMSYSNVVASLALFVALGGGAYAAATITSADVKNDSLTPRDFKDIRHLKASGPVAAIDSTVNDGPTITNVLKAPPLTFYIECGYRDLGSPGAPFPATVPNLMYVTSSQGGSLRIDGRPAERHWDGSPRVVTGSDGGGEGTGAYQRADFSFLGNDGSAMSGSAALRGFQPHEGPDFSKCEGHAEVIG